MRESSGGRLREKEALTTTHPAPQEEEDGKKIFNSLTLKKKNDSKA